LIYKSSTDWHVIRYNLDYKLIKQSAEELLFVDVIKKESKQYLFSRAQFTILGVLSILLILGLYAKSSLEKFSVKHSEIIIGTVVNGDLDVVIEGYGLLKPAKQRLITALTRATVKEIILKPGASVTSESIILKMENPELDRQVDSARQQLAQEEANLRQLKLNHKREALDENAKIAEIISQFESVKLKRLAEEKLVNDGIIAKNTFKNSLLNEKQLKQRIKIFKQRQKQLTDVHREAINIQLEKVKQQQGKVEISKQRSNRLLVRAGIDGVLQRLPVELGQSVAAGQELALIGSVKELVALVKVPQSQAQQLQINQQAMIDTRRDKLEGTVVRIDPVVKNNTVTVELSLPIDLPTSMRPQSNIDALIITDKLKNVNYIERPANVKANAIVEMYILDSSYNFAILKKVRFGQQAGRFIEIVSDVKIGEQFIISDLTNLKKMATELQIK